ncbi:hypothetical protein PGT21_015382 [Puccinia graminis f. sp. tritici]|uniref:Uncharacterized protein n=1 Tax=Puccinia graminis f. sp. tritici TaxID=56615 RepID=A0A5B0MET1_PUCGR|nr:hypothetical protein PGT21_015382 [Puccinia graminis f. sp. tritici]KAA1115904.1 hypothetical protein PGTUg99_018482 [Puccinia graminis f. sp. tritici]
MTASRHPATEKDRADGLCSVSLRPAHLPRPQLCTSVQLIGRIDSAQLVYGELRPRCSINFKCCVKYKHCHHHGTSIPVFLGCKTRSQASYAALAQIGKGFLRISRQGYIASRHESNIQVIDSLSVFSLLSSCSSSVCIRVHEMWIDIAVVVTMLATTIAGAHGHPSPAHPPIACN